MDKLELVNAVMSNQSTMVAQLHQWCEINSGTDNLAGLTRMVDVLNAAFTPIADTIEIKPVQPIPFISMNGEQTIQVCGNALLIRKRTQLKRRILLSGHMDTVYGANHPFQHLTQVNDNQIKGPAVADMKGGLLVILHALTAFEQTLEAAHLGWDVFINADEEIGSPASSPLLDELAPHYQAALVYEPAMNATGMLAKNRSGSGKFTLITQGKSAHVGRAFDEGRNAICYLAEIITAINALNYQREGVTLNVGKVAGGTALNCVPDKAAAKVDIRIRCTEDEAWVFTELDKIKQQFQRPGFELNLQGHFGRPAKRVDKGTTRLFHQLQTLGNSLNLNLNWQDSGGCCDGNNLAQHGLPVLDTLGVRGGNIHSEEEFILLDSLAERAALSALLIQHLAQGGLEELKL